MSLLMINTSMATDNILILGDSLSAGYGLKPEENWVFLLQRQLDKKDLKYKIVNASISGDTTANGLNRLPHALEQYRPKLVILELGANDGLRGLPINYAKKNLEKIINRIHQHQAEILLVGMRIPPNYGKKYTQAFSAIFPTLAKQYQLPLVPFMLDGVAGDPAMIQLDGLHPNALAQRRIMENIWSHLKHLITK